jgi:hypothetical protein
MTAILSLTQRLHLACMGCNASMAHSSPGTNGEALEPSEPCAGAGMFIVLNVIVQIASKLTARLETHHHAGQASRCQPGLRTTAPARMSSLVWFLLPRL